MTLKQFLEVKKQQRRNFLVGAGTIIALPFLESLYPNKLHAQANASSPVRFVFGYIENGIDQDFDGTNDFGGLNVLKNFDSVADYTNFYKGMSIKKARLTNPKNPHPSYQDYFFSAQTKNSFDIHIRNYLKNKYGNSSKFDPIQFSFSGRHKELRTFTVSKEENKFNDRLITSLIDLQKKSMDATAPPLPPATQTNGFFRKSLDYVVDSMKDINKKLSPTDKILLEKHLESINKIYKLGEEQERELASVPAVAPGTCRQANGVAPLSQLNWKQRNEVAAEIIANAIICDSRRIFAVLSTDGRGSSQVNPKYEEVSASYKAMVGFTGKKYDHDMTHNKNLEAQIKSRFGVDGRKYASKVRREIHEHTVGMYTKIAERLKEARDPDGRTVLENCLIHFGSDLSYAHLHNRSNLFSATIGKAGGKLKTGQKNIQLGETSTADLQAALMKAAGHTQNIYGGANDNNSVNKVLSKIKA